MKIVTKPSLTKLPSLTILPHLALTLIQLVFVKLFDSLLFGVHLQNISLVDYVPISEATH